MSRRPDSLPILRLITRLNVGGPSRQALLLTRVLAPEFHTTLAAGIPAPSEGELADDRVAVRHVPLVRPLHPSSDARAVLAVRRLLVETNARLLHTHMAKAGFVGRSAALSLRPRPRTVHTFHGHVLDGYFRPGVQRAFVEIERRLARQTDVLVAISTEIRDALLNLDIGRPDQYRVIPVGLDLSRHLAAAAPSGALRSRIGIGPDVPLIGAAGRLVPIKDISTLLKALVRVPDAHLALIGDGELRERLEAESTTLGLDGRVHFTGWLSDMAQVLSDVDIVALTSRNEGTPVSLIEAAASGRPAVAANVGGVSQVVVDGVTGLLTPAGSPDETATALRHLLDDPGRRRQMGEAARSHVRDRFGQDRLISEIRALYGELCSR